jgi:hypothetical protein
MTTDKALYQSFLDGSEAALSVLRLRYTPDMRTMLAKRFPGEHDIVAEVITLTFEAVRAEPWLYDRDMPLRPWLLTVALNCGRELESLRAA